MQPWGSHADLLLWLLQDHLSMFLPITPYPLLFKPSKLNGSPRELRWNQTQFISETLGEVDRVSWGRNFSNISIHTQNKIQKNLSKTPKAIPLSTSQDPCSLPFSTILPGSVNLQIQHKVSDHQSKYIFNHQNLSTTTRGGGAGL